MIDISNIDKPAWGLMLMPTAVSIGLFVFQYKYKTISSLGLFIFSVIALIMFSIGLVFAVSDLSKAVNQPTSPPTTPGSDKTPPQAHHQKIDDIFPPEDALTLHSINTSAFALTNWVSWGASSIELNAWARLGGQFVKIGSNSYGYLGNADSVTIDYKIQRSKSTIILACISYVLNGHRVEAINFFSNSDGANFRSIRPRIVEVDGRGELCRSMPGNAERAL